MLLRPEDSVLIIIDVQEKLFRVILNKESVLRNILKLVRVCKLLNIPIIITEQYPQGLGSTVLELVQELGDLYKPVTKMSFSCFKCEEFRRRLQELGRKTLMLTGIELHICVYQTAVEALAHGFKPVVIYDATGSRLELDYKIALYRLVQKGVEIATTDMIIFELVQDASHPVFKEILKIVKE